MHSCKSEARSKWEAGWVPISECLGLCLPAHCGNIPGVWVLLFIRLLLGSGQVLTKTPSVSKRHLQLSDSWYRESDRAPTVQIDATLEIPMWVPGCPVWPNPPLHELSKSGVDSVGAFPPIGVVGTASGPQLRSRLQAMSTQTSETPAEHPPS